MIDETRAIVFSRAGWRCEWCGKPLSSGVPQLAHRIPQNVQNLKKYGAAVIHHPDNLAAACSLYCNGRMDIRGWPLKIAELAKNIQEKLDKNERCYTIHIVRGREK